MTELWQRNWLRATVCAVVLLTAALERSLAQTNEAEGGTIAAEVKPAVTLEATNAIVDAATNAALATATNAPASGTHKPGGVKVKREAVVTILGNAELKADETAEAVVAICGNAIAKGKVTDAVVAVMGNAEVSGEVGDAVVAVMGNVKLLPGAKVRGEVVSVGGRIERAEDVEIGGQVQEVGFGGLHTPKLDWLKPFLKECVFLARPLSLGVGWVWVVTGVFLLLYLLVALAFPRPVELCVQEITERPATTLLMGLLTKLLAPIIALVLLATGIGVFIVPFFIAALVFAGIVGKVAILQYLGRQITRAFAGGVQQPLVAFLAGWMLITLLYLVPVLGIVVYAVAGMWAIGAAVMAMFGSSRREREQRASSIPPAPPPPTGGTYATAQPMAFAPAPQPAAASAPIPVTGVMPGDTAAFAATPPTLASLQAPISPPPPDALSLPRAGFWERMGAAFLDVILVSILAAIVGGAPLGFLVMLAYFAGMWAWKGTTVGGVVLKLKVVRLDGAPISFPVALVRGLGAAFSTVVLFLGFFWIAWDVEKQSWHDKIAGTAVVRLPRTQSLVCF